MFVVVAFEGIAPAASASNRTCPKLVARSDAFGSQTARLISVCVVAASACLHVSGTMVGHSYESVNERVISHRLKSIRCYEL